MALNLQAQISGQDQPNLAAIKARKVKTVVPSELTAAEWRAVSGPLKERAAFAARCNLAQFVERVNDRVTDLVRGVSPAPGEYTNVPTVRLELKQLLGELGYAPKEGEAGTIKDLSSDGRLNLIIQTNEQTAQGYGQYEQAFDPDTLDDYPAFEFIRIEDREKERDWEQRWTEAARYCGDNDALRCLDQSGRMVAAKDSDIWDALGDLWDDSLGNPYPPFAFNSGMWTIEVNREEAEDLGVVKPGQTIKRDDRGFDDDLEVPAPVKDASLKKALLSALGENFGIVGDILKRVA
jgi:hypothetical protein